MSAYCTRTDIENLYGTANVSKWADRENNQDTGQITARITLAIGIVSSFIDAYLRDIYDTPFATTPDVVKNIAVLLAGVELYEGRGVEDFNPETNLPFHKLAWHRSRAMRDLQYLKSGVLKLDFSPAATTVPTVIATPDAGTDICDTSPDLEIVDRY